MDENKKVVVIKGEYKGQKGFIVETYDMAKFHAVRLEDGKEYHLKFSEIQTAA